MSTPTIKIAVSQADATLVQSCTLTAGMQGTAPVVRFSFSDEWENLGKTVVFRAGTVVETVWMSGNEADVPDECLATAGVNLIVGVYGVNVTTLNVIIPTVWCACGEILDGTTYEGAANIGTATPSLVDQMSDYAEQVANSAETLETYAVRTFHVNMDDADSYGVADATLIDSGAGANRDVTIKFTDLKGNGIASIQWSPVGARAGLIRITTSDGINHDFDALCDAIDFFNQLTNLSEAYAKGTIEGVDVEEDEPGYQDNAKYYAEMAEDAQDGAETAQAAAEAAQEAAEDAQEAAESAQTAAETAQTAAEQASAAALSSAGTASAEEQNASGYATAAAASANDAETARTSAETWATTAQGYANSAQASANNAYSSANTAGTSAVSAAASATAAAESARQLEQVKGIFWVNSIQVVAGTHITTAAEIDAALSRGDWPVLFYGNVDPAPRLPFLEKQEMYEVLYPEGEQELTVYKFGISKSETAYYSIQLTVDHTHNTETWSNLTTTVAPFARKNDIAEEHSNSSAYKTGDYRYHAGTLYKCKSDIPVENWTYLHWKSTYLADDVAGLTRSFAGVFSETAVYYNGDYVLYLGELYRCTRESTGPRTWDQWGWEKVVLTNEIKPLLVTLTPNPDATDLRGTMDMSPRQIAEAYHAGRKIRFTVPALGNVTGECTEFIPVTVNNYTYVETWGNVVYQNFNGIDILITVKLRTDQGNAPTYYYDTTIYPLTPMSQGE